MEVRERFLRTLQFQSVDRVPLVEWPIRPATMRAWVEQGYPEGVSSNVFFGLDTFHVGIPIDMGIRPRFEEKILEQNDKYKIWQDDLGAIRKDFIKDATPGFVTRSWLSFPVEDWAGFEEMKKRYRKDAPGRIPENIGIRSDILRQSPVPTHLSIPFLFWTMRDWMGFENLCMTFYDDPALIDAMCTFITDFCLETLDGLLDRMQVDIVELKEDMAYKHAPMISPEMFRRFMKPHYVRLITYLKSHGVKLVYVDCDGYPGSLIPEYIDAGVDAMSPVEIAAGNDLLKLREEYPTFGMMGGIDKRELAKDFAAIDREVLSKVPAMLEKGGYIPHVDHAIPPDVPLENYLYYRRLLTKVVYGEPID
ncbi:MAG: uroporphyrinogen decarboxylase family protein [Candidatus Merdivicinus sp.]|jgi:hypothetical protein